MIKVVKSALCIHRFHMCEFNHLQVVSASGLVESVDVEPVDVKV